MKIRLNPDSLAKRVLGIAITLPLTFSSCSAVQEPYPVWHKDNPNTIHRNEDSRQRILFSYWGRDKQHEVILLEKKNTQGWRITKIQGLENQTACDIFKRRLPKLFDAIENEQEIFIEDSGYGLRFYNAKGKTITTYTDPIPL